MPLSAPRPCPKPGCPTLIRGKQRYCVEHGRVVEQQKPQRLRGDAGVRRRRLFLQQNPLCKHCADEGRIKVGDEVDHVVSLADGGEDVWANLQTLCFDHHSAKTAREQAYRNRRIG